MRHALKTLAAMLTAYRAGKRGLPSYTELHGIVAMCEVARPQRPALWSTTHTLALPRITNDPELAAQWKAHGYEVTAYYTAAGADHLDEVNEMVERQKSLLADLCLETVGLLSRMRRLLQDRHDAARYRWLRSRDLSTIYQDGVFAGKTPDCVVINGEDLDAAVDTAMLREQTKNRGACGLH